MPPKRVLDRHLAILAGAQLVSVAGVVAMVTLGGIIGQRLAPSPALATLPLSFLVLGIAASTILAAWCMARIGRPRGFAVGALIGCGGYGLAALAMAWASFGLFLVAAVLVGAANAFAQQYRFAATEHAPEAPAQAVAIVLIGSLGGAVLGPALANHGVDWFADAPFAGTFAALAVAGVGAAAAVLRLDIDPFVQGVARDTPRPLRDMTRQPLFLAAVIGGVGGFAAMNLVMTAAPLSMHAGEGHSLADTAAVVQAHVIAMYLPSLFTGHLVARFGVGSVMAAGAAILAAMLALGFMGQAVMHYAAVMIALGLGWNFLYVGGTVLLGQAHRPAERFRAQAINDFSVFGMSAAGSLSAGLMLHGFGWHGVLVAAAAPIMAAALALAVVRPDRRMAMP